jgi:hypothetical protein
MFIVGLATRANRRLRHGLGGLAWNITAVFSLALKHAFMHVEMKTNAP